MRSLTRTPKAPRPAGDPINLNIPELRNIGVSIRTGELSMFAAPPGAGKSTLAMAIALGSNQPTLYVCCDTSEHTIRVRQAAMITGKTQAEVEHRMDRDDEWAKTVQQPGGHITWTFPDQPALSSIEQEIYAYEEVFGHDPKLIIIDNLSDIARPDGDEWAGLRRSMEGAKHLAKMTSSALVVLHHTSEGATYQTAPPMSSVQGKVSQLPALVLTIGQDPGLMYVAAVKNRYGRGDAFATNFAALSFDGERMQLGANA